MRSAAAAAVVPKNLKNPQLQAFPANPVLRLGTDCSGAEAPVWSMRAMKVPHQHLFSSDNATGPQQIIQANTPPTQKFFTDMVARCTDEVPHVDIYVAGFPCKPFSSLHHGSQLLKEKQAKPFFAVIKTLKTMRPAAAVLENVKGIARVDPRITSAIRGAGYAVARVLMNPADVGQAVQRPRYYYIAIRKDLAWSSEASIATFTQEVYKHLVDQYRGERVPLTSCCLPKDHPEVKRNQAARRAKLEAARNIKVMKSSKWVDRHRKFKMSGSSVATGVRTAVGLPSADDMLIALPRERDIWQRVSSQWAHASLTLDLSQSLGRGGMRADGTTPTITPGSHIASSVLGRALVPVDKLLLHAFPVHRMRFPASLTDDQISSLGGNTMHLVSVGTAMLIAIALVDWSVPGARSTGLASPPDRLSRRRVIKHKRAKQTKLAQKKKVKATPTKHAQKKKAKAKLTNQNVRYYTH